ncbi:MAG TPA: DUF4148 domain-containing protein [Paraburkholderia sp.]|jgi:hypothetical protein
MKRTLLAALLVSVLTVPAVSFAAQPLTRAQVRAELVELQQAGYRGDTETSYPAAIQAAEERVAGNHGQSGAPAAEAGSYGTDAAGTDATGTRKHDTGFTGMKPIYSGQ